MNLPNNISNILSISNRIKQHKNCCIHCGKSYKLKTNLDKHYLLCDLIYSRKTVEDETLPSQKQMYQIILDLSQKYNKLEEKLNEINRRIIKTKKINILEWLNENLQPDLIFENITEKIIITTSHIEYLFYNSFYDTLNEILISIYTLDEMNNPLFAFAKKSNTFYIFDKITDKNVWTEMSNDKLTRFLNKIQIKISKGLQDWKKNNLQKIQEREDLSNLYDKTIIKLMKLDFGENTILLKTKKIMYDKMKSNIKSMVEYEFEF